MIGEALSLTAPNRRNRPFHVRDFPRVVAEIELSQVPMQMLLFAMLVDAAHPTFED